MARSDIPLLNNSSGEAKRLSSAVASYLRHDKMMTDDCLPAIVISYDRDRNTATVRPCIQWVDLNGGVHQRLALEGINVLSLGGGGFHINFPIKPGDLGWLCATDRDISIFKESLKESQPNTGRLHKFEDGWFIPDVLRKYIVHEDDAAAMVIQSTDATTRISINDGFINITTKSAVNTKAPSSFNVDSASGNFSGNLATNSGASGTFGTTTGQTVTVQAGIVTNIG